jgi:hypothetical protein
LSRSFKFSEGNANYATLHFQINSRLKENGGRVSGGILKGSIRFLSWKDASNGEIGRKTGDAKEQEVFIRIRTSAQFMR